MSLILALLVILLIPFLIAYGIMSWGFVLYKFWYWFLIPIFPEIPEISYLAAVGLYTFTAVLKNHNVSELKDEYKKKNIWHTALWYPWLVLLIGWCVYYYTN